MEFAEFQRFLQFYVSRFPAYKPMPEEQIQLICAQFPHRKMPEFVLTYLRTCGGWLAAGASEAPCKLIEDGIFHDYGEFIREWDDSDEGFRQYGFAYEDCFFFLDSQDLLYEFIHLDGLRDDPLVYRFWVLYDYDRQSEPILFSQWCINLYNRRVPDEEKWTG